MASLRPGQKLPGNIEELDGTVKAAVLLLTLDHAAAGALLKKMPTDTVEEVTRVLASLGEVPAELSMQVIEEFYSLRMAAQSVREGGLDYAKALLKDRKS